MSDPTSLQTTGDGAPPSPQSVASKMIPQTLGELEQFAQTVSQSQLCPKSYRGKPQDVTLAILYGMEVGLRPLQSLQSVAVINGKPAIYGDAALALVEQSGLAEYVKEWQEQTERGLTAICEAQKKGKPEPTRQTFSEQEAKNAGLWGGRGPWSDYPRRMLQMRARSWCLRDCFPEVLEGLYLAEEAEAIPDDAGTTIDPSGLTEPDAEEAQASSEPETEEVFGFALSPENAERIRTRDEALSERKGEARQEAYDAIQKEVEEWPPSTVKSAGEALLDKYAERLPGDETANETAESGAETADAPQDPDEVKAAAESVSVESDDPNDEAFEDADGELPF